eukprot:356051-Chlamydomonas_euryale.AAC.5
MALSERQMRACHMVQQQKARMRRACQQYVRAGFKEESIKCVAEAREDQDKGTDQTARKLEWYDSTTEYTCFCSLVAAFHLAAYRRSVFGAD